MEFDHLVYEKDNSIRTFVSDADFTILQSTGFIYEVLIDDWYTHYENLPKLTEFEKQQFIKHSKDNFNVGGFGYGSMGGFYTLAEINAELDSMYMMYPNIITQKFSVGLSIENRPIYAVKISDNPTVNESEPHVHMNSLSPSPPYGQRRTLTPSPILLLRRRRLGDVLAPYHCGHCRARSGTQGTCGQMKLYLADGTVAVGRAFGADREVCGEVVFNTGMSGYVETRTDPSYRGQILVLTYPLQGNYGVPNGPFESARIQVEGLVVTRYSEHPSHHASHVTLRNWLKDQGVPAIDGVDTRTLTRRLREYGTMPGYLLHDATPVEAARESVQPVDMSRVIMANRPILKTIGRSP